MVVGFFDYGGPDRNRPYTRIPTNVENMIFTSIPLENANACFECIENKLNCSTEDCIQYLQKVKLYVDDSRGLSKLIGSPSTLPYSPECAAVCGAPPYHVKYSDGYSRPYTK